MGESRTATRRSGVWRGLGEREEEEEGLGNVNVVKREGTRDSKVPWSIDIEREREALRCWTASKMDPEWSFASFETFVGLFFFSLLPTRRIVQRL